jgi:hypothetical protein
MKRKFYLLFVLVVISSSCLQKLDQHQLNSVMVNPLNADSTYLSEITSKIDMIILETNDSCLITGITEIEKSSEYLFINDAGKRILQFDPTGKFIKQVGSNGRGPGEYIGIISIAIDNIRSTIYASAFNKILCYDFSGNFKYEIKAGYSEFIIFIKDKLWTIYTKIGTRNIHNSDYINTTSLIRFDPDGKKHDTVLINKVFLSSFSGTINPQAFYISDLDSVQYIYCPVLVPEPEPVMRDTLYELKENKLTPSLKLNFGKAGEVINGKKQVFIKNIFRSCNYIFAEYSFGRKELFYCFNISKKKAYNVQEGFIDDYFGTGIVHLKPLNLNEELLYFIKEPLEIKQDIKGISEDSNPIIFIVKLKNQ